MHRRLLIPFRPRLRRRENPLRHPDGRTAVWVTHDDDFIRVLIYTTDGGYIAYGEFDIPDDPTLPMYPMYVGALRGFGPLVYYLAATLAKRPIAPSLDRSDHATRFWDNVDDWVWPMSPDEFQRTFRTSIGTLVRRGGEYPPSLDQEKWMWEVTLHAVNNDISIEEQLQRPLP